MTKRKYEKVLSIFIISIIVWIIEIVLLFQLFKLKINDYHKITVLLINNQEGIIVVDQKDKKIIYNNSYGYWNDKKIEYIILEEKKMEENNWIQIRLKLKFHEKKTNEIIEITIKKKKISMIESIINSWDGDKNN